MKNKRCRNWAVLSLVLCLVSFSLTVGDFLALHDIRNDYVSKTPLALLGNPHSKELPVWTATPTEWALVRLSWLTRVSFFALNTVAWVLCLRALRRGGDRLAETRSLE